MTNPQDLQSDRELVLVVQMLERLAVRVEAQFNPDVVEGEEDPAGTHLLAYARSCREVLDDPAVSARLQAVAPRRW
ncbi:hypothetical protein [Nocardia sp. NPDC050175]|uniref:hypothetical protein n=1 Tax=Nocardia sp. NPDC050175 TaxID=3364317 RepID=UPI003796B181